MRIKDSIHQDNALKVRAPRDAVRADFGGRVAVVTGASRGIGIAVAEALLGRGASVVLSSRHQADLEAVATRFNETYPERAIPVAAHAGKPDDLRRLVDETMNRCGRVDVLVCNAATNPYMGPLIQASLGLWDKTLEVNLRGPFALTKEVVEAWMGANGGAIVNVASVGGLRPGGQVGIYNVAKAALIMLTRQLAVELGGLGIRVNAVAPGLIKTRLSTVLWQDGETLKRVIESNPLGRVGTAEEVGAAVAFLASDAAGYINGAVLEIDGGGAVFA
jgi:NAD(P)-dependent dehydrogenase (short-subunit alcohol dehydrogenase family)